MPPRLDQTKDFMKIISTPPSRNIEFARQYEPKIGYMRMVSGVDGREHNVYGLGELGQSTQTQCSTCNVWVPVVIIVVSAMALLTFYVVMRK